MNRLRLVLVLALLFGAVVGTRFYLKAKSHSLEALDRNPEIELAAESETPADLVSPQQEQEPATEAPLVAAHEDADRVAIAAEAATATDLVVQIIDKNGDPVANLPVQIECELIPGNALVVPGAATLNVSALAAVESALHGTSNSQGRVVFEDVKELVESIVSTSPEGASNVNLVHKVIFEELPRRVITMEDLEQDVIVSVMPDFGSIRGEVLDTEGNSGAPAERVELLIVTETSEGNPFENMHSHRFAGTYEKGVAHFPFVELGREWSFLATRGGEYNERTQSLGPRIHLEETKVTVQYGSREPILQFRVLDVDGLVYANGPLDVQVSAEFDTARVVGVHTDERGVFKAYFSLTAYSFFTPVVRISTEDPSGQSLEARSEPLEGLEPGINDRGTLQLQRPSLLASGTVLSEKGVPFEGAIVRIGEQEDYAEDSWFESEVVETKSDAYGHFEIYGVESDDALSIWAFHGEARAERQALVGFGNEFFLKLRTLPTCSVSVRLAPGVPADQVRVQLVHHENDGTSGSLSADQVTQENGVDGFTTTFTNVLPRTYDVRATAGRNGVLLAEAPAVEVLESGEIASFDLTDVLFLQLIQFDLPAGSEKDDQTIAGTYQIRASETDGAWSGWKRFQGPTLEIATTDPQIDVRLMPKSFHAEEVLGLQGQRRITFRAPLLVRFVLDTTGEIPVAPYSLQLRITLDSKEVGHALGGRGLTKKRREIIYELPKSGYYIAEWTLLQAAENIAIEGPVLGDHKREIEVRESAGEQVIRLPLDSNALTEMTRNPPWG